MARLALAVDLGGTQVRAALIAEDGTVRDLQTALTLGDQGPAAVVDQISTLVKSIGLVDEVAGIGVSAPGPLDTRTGIVLALQSMTGFDGFPLGDALGSALGSTVRLENDGIAGAIGEWRYGAGRGCADMLYVTVSTGIGGGVICNGRPVRGRRGLAGHVGHTLHHRDSPRFGGGVMPCWEDYCSGTSLAARARQLARERPSSRLAARKGLDAEGVFAAAAAGDALASEIVEEEATSLGIGLASLVHVLDPERIVIGGGLSNAFAALEPGLRSALRAHAKPGFEDVDLVSCSLRGLSGLLGAAALVFDPV